MRIFFVGGIMVKEITVEKDGKQITVKGGKTDMRKSDKNEMKIYAIPTVIPFTVIFSVLFVAAIMVAIWTREAVLIVFVAAAGFLLSYFLWYLCRPIYVSPKGVRRGKNHIDWQDVRIVTYPVFSWMAGRVNPKQPFIVFCDKNNVNIRAEVDKRREQGLCVLVKEKSLEAVFRYYHKRIDTLDSYCDIIAPIGMNKKCREKILAHNAEFFDVSDSDKAG